MRVREGKMRGRVTMRCNKGEDIILLLKDEYMHKK